MGTKQYDNALDLITFSRASGGTALRKISYGSELVTNGTFDTDVSGWTGADGTIAAVSGELELTYTTDTQYVYASVSTTAGKVYRLNIDGRSANSVNWKLIVQANLFGGTTLAETAEHPFSSSLETRSVNFVATSATTVILMFSRLTSGTAYFDNVSVREVLFDQPDGTLTLFNHPDDIPRIDYNPDGTVRGLLIEEQRTNLLTYSSEFDNAAWTAVESTVTADQIAAPDGTTAADLFVPSTNNVSNHVIRQNATLAAAKHTWSVFAKAAGYDWVRLFHVDGDATEYSAYFDLANGTVGTVGAGATATIQDFGNGWYKCSITPDAAASASSARNQFVYAATDDVGHIFAGDGTSGVYLWGAQLEEGSFPTSYIPTSGASATREPDIASIPVTDFGYNQKAGTVVVTGCKIDRVSTIAGTEIAILAKVAFSTDNATRVFYRASGATGFFNTVSASTNVDLSPTGVLSAGQDLNIAFTYSEDDFATVANGGTVLTDTSGVVAEHTVLRIGAGQQHLNGHIKSIQYYPRRLTNAQLQELTA